MERYSEEQYVNSLIGFGSSFRGDIDSDGFFRIDGDFSGSIKTESKVLIGSTGRADCAITARMVVIGGAFRGTIYARDKVIILSSALVIGSLYTPRLVAEEGVLLNGTLVVSGHRQRDVKGSGEHYPVTKHRVSRSAATQRKALKQPG